MFGSLPARRSPLSSRSLAASVAFHAIAAMLLLTVRFTQSTMPPEIAEHRITLVAPAPALLPPPQPRPLPPRETAPVPPVRLTPRAFQPAAPVSAPRTSATTLATPPPPEIAQPSLGVPQSPQTGLAIALPEPPPKPVVLGTLSSAQASAPAASTTPAVKAAGFGAAASSSPGPAGSRSTSVGGFGAAHTASAGPRHEPSAEASGFGDIRAAAPGTPPQPPAAPAATTPVEILSKPRPAYTDEARALRLEGEVLLEVLFTANGEARVVCVVNGLGHGLDETAIAAARAIQFRPARRAGTPVDSSAIVHIVFQLAY